MKISSKTYIVGSAIALATLGGLGYAYVFLAGAPQLDPPKADVHTGLTFQVKSFNSVAMGGDRRYGVILPPGYLQNPKKRFPVIVILHGGHGSERDFEDKAKLTSVVHELYKVRGLPPSIVITPDGNDQRGSNPFWDPDYFDGPNGKVGTLIGKELVKVVKQRYRTLNQPEFWAIGGSSSGAYGAMNIGLRNTHQFHSFFSHTGYFTDKSGVLNSPQQFIQQIPVGDRPQLRVYLDAGEEDQKYLQATIAFRDALEQAGIATEFHQFPGGHGIVGQDVGWNYWHKHLTNSLSFVGQRFKVALEHYSQPHKQTGKAGKVGKAQETKPYATPTQTTPSR